MCYFTGTEPQQINVAPSSESFTSWRTILSPTWPSRELESSSVGDLSMRQALENANLLQIIKSTLAGTRTRTMDQTRFFPSLYQGSGGNSASQAPSEVPAESPMKSREADEMSVLSGLPQISVFPTLSTSPSVTHATTTVSSQITPRSTSSISKKITTGSDILSSFPSPSPLPLITKSPHLIFASELTVPATKVPSFIDKESSSTISPAIKYSNILGNPSSIVLAGNSSTTKYKSRKGGKEFSVSTSVSNNLIRRYSTRLAGRHTHPGNRKLHSPTLHAIISYQTSLFSSERMPLNSSRIWGGTGLMHNTSSKAVLTTQSSEAIVLYKEPNSYVNASSPVLTSNIAIPGTSVPSLYISSIPSPLFKVITDLPSTLLSSSTKAISLLPVSDSPMGLFHLMNNVSSHTVPTIFVSERISANSAVEHAPASTNMPVSHSRDRVISLMMETNQTFIAALAAIVSGSNDKGISKIHLTNPHVREPINWIFSKKPTYIASEATATTQHTASELPLWSPKHPLMRSLRQQSLTKAKSFTDANTSLPPQSPGIQTVNFTLDISDSKQMLGTALSLKSTSSDALSLVSLPTSVRDFLLESDSAASFVASPHDSGNLQLSASNVQIPTSLTEEEEKDAKAFSTVMPQTEYVSQHSLHESDGISSMADASFWNTGIPTDTLPGFPPEPLGNPGPASLAVSNAVSKSTSDMSNKDNIFRTTPSASDWYTGDWQSSTDTHVSSGKKITQMSPTAEDYGNRTALRTVVPGLQQQANYVNKQTSSSFLSTSVNTSVTAVQNVLASAFTGTKWKGFTDFDTSTFGTETPLEQYSSSISNQSALSQSTEVPPSQSENKINASGDVLEYFTVRSLNNTSNSGKKFHPTSKDFLANTRIPASMDAFSPSLSTYSYLATSVSYNSHTMPKPQTTDSGTLSSSIISSDTTSPSLSLATQFIAKMIFSVNNEISSISGTKAVAPPTPIYKFLSLTPISNHSEEYTSSGKYLTFTSSHVSETNYNSSKQQTSLNIFSAKDISSILDTVTVPNEASKTTPLPIHTTSALQSAIMPSIHAPPPQLTSLLPTTDFTHSVITVLSSVSPGVIPSVATSGATPVTGKSAPTSPMLTSSLFSLSTENPPSVMALSTLISTLAKNNTATSMALTLSPVATHASFSVASRDKSTSSVHSTSSFPVTNSSTVSTPTTHSPRQTETTILDTKKSTSSDSTKTSTAYPLTITAALTSITASAKTTRLLPTPAENTAAAAPTPASTAAIANVTTVLPLECQLSRNFLVKTGISIFLFVETYYHMEWEGTTVYKKAI